MIVWISGPYGVGKSTIAEAISAKLDNALIFDAEEVGNAVRGNYPDCPYGYLLKHHIVVFSIIIILVAPE